MQNISCPLDVFTTRISIAIGPSLCRVNEDCAAGWYCVQTGQFGWTALQAAILKHRLGSIQTELAPVSHGQEAMSLALSIFSHTPQ